ncbi:methyltransferase [Candidatus Marsarchaeota archaeon]|nr:methyltransferase [Candidatus Marsarchaeota archaeon]MCL5404389.1 methyltransferase [Candidatus Marsarchaeota archaeon]
MYEEGAARIEAGEAFLNPKARLSRDISVAYLLARGSVANALDMTSATGIRGIRYAKECGIDDVTMLEINKNAFDSMAKNLRSNSMDNAKAYNTSVQEFCNMEDSPKFDAIDIDPFGSPAPYMYDALKVAHDGTSIMVTATDTAVLCGAQPNACKKIYHSVPMHNELGHEAGVRILACFIADLAAQFNFGISVEFAFSYLHYIRVIVRLAHGSKHAVKSVNSSGFAYKCEHCGWLGMEKGYFTSIQSCPNCSHEILRSGRLWLGEIKSDAVAKKIGGRMTKMLKGRDSESKFVETVIHEGNTPFYYSIPKLTKLMHIRAVSPFDVVKSLQASGIGASLTHFEKSCIKTEADVNELKARISAIVKP